MQILEILEYVCGLHTGSALASGPIEGFETTSTDLPSG
jgi:hypothetical protein